MHAMHRARIVVGDDHRLFAEGCKAFLEPEFEVVNIVTDGRAAVEAAAKLAPDVVILDISMPLLNGLEAAVQIKQARRATKIIFVTAHPEAELAAEAFRRGASAYVVKHAVADELVLAVRGVMKGGSYISPMITKDTVTFLLRTGNSRKSEKKLTKREAEVLQLLAEGKSMKEVGYLLNLKPGTVAYHKYRMMERLELKSNAELLQYAIKHHILA